MYLYLLCMYMSNVVENSSQEKIDDCLITRMHTVHVHMSVQQMMMILGISFIIFLYCIIYTYPKDKLML